MIIRVDEEGKRLLQSLCGVAVESIGEKVLPLVNTILSKTTDMPPQKEQGKQINPKKQKNTAEAK